MYTYRLYLIGPPIEVSMIFLKTNNAVLKTEVDSLILIMVNLIKPIDV